MELDPQARALLALVYRAGVPRLHELTVEQARLSTQKTLRTFRPDPPAVASLADISIPRPGDAPLMARLYQPIKPGPAIFLPVLIYFHGGGWCLGDIESYDVLCRQLANFSGCAVLSVDYRLTPEHPFPAAIDDALLATDWVADNAKSLALDGQRIALGGGIAPVATWPSSPH